MDIRISGHQVDTGAAFGDHVRERLSAMVAKYFPRALSAHVTLGPAPYGHFACDIVMHVMADLILKGSARAGDAHIAFDAAADPMERLEIHRKIQGLPRNSAKVRLRNRCWATGKPRGVYRDFGLCRNQLRERAHKGEQPGVVKSSW